MVILPREKYDKMISLSRWVLNKVLSRKPFTIREFAVLVGFLSPVPKQSLTEKLIFTDSGTLKTQLK